MIGFTLASVASREAVRALVFCLTVVTVCGCSGSADRNDKKDGSKPEAQVGTEAGARALLEKFLQPGADHAALTRPLRPAKEDYAAVFQGGFARKAETAYAAAWDGGKVVAAPKAGQTQLLLKGVSTEDLRKKAPAADDLPGGYKQIAEHFKDGLTIYRFKFVKPGDTLGMAFDGLIFVNGSWRWFPKPWQVVK